MSNSSYLMDMIEKYPHAAYYYCLKLNINYLKYIEFTNIKLPGYIHFKSFSSSYKGFKDVYFQALVQSKLQQYKLDNINYPRLNFGIERLYDYLDLFKTTDESIKFLLKKERIWHNYESTVIVHPYGHYSKEYIIKKYGREAITLEQYEDLLNDLDGLNNFIDLKEAPYRKIKVKYGPAVDEFEKSHPDIPHSEYGTYDDEIHRLAIKGKSVLYHNYQRELAVRIKERLSPEKVCNILSRTTNCTLTDFNHDKKDSTIDWCILFSKYLFEGVENTSKISYYKQKFPLCHDLFIDLEEDLKTFSPLDFLKKSLPHIVRIYQSKFVQLCIVVEDELQVLDITPARILKILEASSINTKNLEVIPELLFKFNHLKHIPYLFISSVDAEISLKQKAKELINSEIIFSLMPLYYAIDYDGVESINEERLKIDIQNKTTHINSLKTKYPNGFYTFCEKHGIKTNDLISHFDLLKSGEDDMSILEKQYKETQIINKAKLIIQHFPNVAKDEGYSSSSVITYHQAERIIYNENNWKEVEQIYYGRRNIFNTGRTLFEIPHKFFYKYYPESRFSNSSITEEDRENRQLIWMFKNGSSYATPKVADLVTSYLSSINELQSIKGRITFICAPASNHHAYNHRFGTFSETVASNLGFYNGSQSLDILSHTQPKHMGGSGDIEYHLEESAIRGRYIIIFDDIVTSGRTISSFANKIQSMGGKILAILSIGQTV